MLSRDEALSMDGIKPLHKKNIRRKIPIIPYLKKKSKKSIEQFVNQNSPLCCQNKFCPEKLVPIKKTLLLEKDSFICVFKDA